MNYTDTAFCDAVLEKSKTLPTLTNEAKQIVFALLKSPVLMTCFEHFYYQKERHQRIEFLEDMQQALRVSPLDVWLEALGDFYNTPKEGRYQFYSTYEDSPANTIETSIADLKQLIARRLEELYSQGAGRHVVTPVGRGDMTTNNAVGDINADIIKWKGTEDELKVLYTVLIQYKMITVETTFEQFKQHFMGGEIKPQPIVWGWHFGPLAIWYLFWLLDHKGFFQTSPFTSEGWKVMSRMFIYRDGKHTTTAVWESIHSKALNNPKGIGPNDKRLKLGIEAVVDELTKTQ